MRSIPVLMYHALEDAGHPAGARDAGEQLYVLAADAFRAQLLQLKKAGMRTLSLQELEHPECWGKDAVVLTFDDGHRSNRTVALPILQELGLKAHFFITTGWIGTPGYLAASEVRELIAAGMGVGSHGVTHRLLNALSEDAMEEELRRSRDTLAEITGMAPASFSAPGGALHPAMAASAARTGYRYLCSSSASRFCEDGSCFSIPRFAVRNDLPLTDFEKLVCGDRWLLRRLQLKGEALGWARKLLGNRGYGVVREQLLRARGGNPS